MNVRPPSISESWDDMVEWDQAMLLAYDQIRQMEEQEIMIAMARVPKVG